MSDAPISGLPAASTPLAGTETLPIVQSGVTDKVTVANLTAGRNVEVASLGVGTSTFTQYRIHVAGSITGASTSFGASIGATIQSDVTGGANGYRTLLGTAVASFTVANLRHFYAQQDTLGAGSIVSVQAGFEAAASLIGATDNYAFWARNTAPVTATKTAYGFRSDIDTATGGGTAWQSYMNGTAPSYFGGSVGIGSTALTAARLRISATITGGTSAQGYYLTSTIQSDVTSTAVMYGSQPSTLNATFTLTRLYHFDANQGTIGAASTVTNQRGFSAGGSLTGAANNYQFYADNAAAVTAGKTVYAFYTNQDVASGGGTTYAFFSAGSAASYFAGDFTVDKTVTAGGTTGARTINMIAGSVNFAGAAASLVVTDSRVTTSSIILATVATNDTTMTSVQAVAGSGSFTLYANVAATAETRVNFWIVN